MKVCLKCKQELPEDKFPRRKERSKVEATCIECRNLVQREYYQSHKHDPEFHRKWNERSKEQYKKVSKEKKDERKKRQREKYAELNKGRIKMKTGPKVGSIRRRYGDNLPIEALLFRTYIGIISRCI